jgi:hypothetical protein
VNKNPWPFSPLGVAKPEKPDFCDMQINQHSAEVTIRHDSAATATAVQPSAPAGASQAIVSTGRIYMRALGVSDMDYERMLSSIGSLIVDLNRK